MNQRRWSVIFLLLASIALPAVAAEDPLAGIGQLLLSGRAAEARPRIEKARQTYIAEGNAAGEAASYVLLGLADAALAKPLDARSDLEQSSAKFTALGDHLGAWMSLFVIAELERQEGSDDAAVAAHERAVALLSDASTSKTHFSIESMKALGPIFGMPLETLGPLAQNPEFLKPILLRLAEMISRDAYGTALMETGALEKADEQLAKAAEMSAAFGGIFDASIAMHTGDLRRRQWRFDEATKSYSKALESVKMVPNLPVANPWTEVEILGKLADMEVLSGRVDEALALNDRVLKIVRGSSNPKREASILEDRGKLLWRAGRFSAAEGVLDDALKVAAKNEDDYRQASLLATLGSIHMYQGAYGTAASQLQKAIKIYQKLNQPYVEAPTWIMLAEVYLMLEDRANAAFAIDKARELAKKSDFKLAGALVELLVEANKYTPGEPIPASLTAAFDTWSARTEIRGLPSDGDDLRLLRGALATLPTVDPGAIPATSSAMFRGIALVLKARFSFERGDFVGARAASMEALKTNPSREHHAGLLAMIGASYWKEGKSHEAIDYFEQSAKVLDSVAADVKVEEMLAGYLGSNRRWYYDILIEMLVQQGRVKEAFEQAERARARAFLQVIGNHRLNAERGADASLVREAEILRTQIAAWEKQANQAARGESVRIASDLGFARQRYTALIARIKTSNPEYAALTTVAPLPLDEVRAELPDNTTLISYFVSPHGVHAWIVDRTALHYTLLPLDAAGLQRVVCWASHFAPARDLRGAERTSSKCGSAATAEEAFAKLIAPLRANIHNTRLLLVPHGPLHYVPFAALHDAASDRYLIDDYTLSYVPSASALRFLRSKETPLDGGALVLGNPNSALPVAGQLPGAQQEAVAVARHLGATPILGPQARESLLYGLGGKIDLLHIAAHAIYDPVNPLFSRIALAPGDGFDGNVDVHEILSTLDLSGVNLVVLSACQTAVGERSGGDEIVGLTRALLYAGTPGVISTLWNIDDASSARLMDEFYRRLAAGELAADALRNAQLALSRTDDYRDPKFWAAFTLTGNPQGRWKAPAP